MSLALRPLLVAEEGQACLVLSGLAPGRSYRISLLPVRQPAVRLDLQASTDGAGRLAWDQPVTWRGEALCDVYAVGSDLALATLHVYAAPAEMLRRRPLRCDLHVHTTFSDGKGTPAGMVLRGRELGLDVLAVTDHGSYEGSQAAIEAAGKLGLGLLCLPGEEVSAPDWHLLSLGADGPVGPVSAGYPGLREALDTIHGLGGRAYLAHPFWTADRRHHLPPQNLDRLLDEGGFDGIELIGDVDWEDNLRSLARYGDERVRGRFWPILGNSDAHGPLHTFGGAWTLVWAGAASQEGVLQAVAEGYSVACTRMTMEPPAQRARPRFQAFGPFELVDLAIFLDRHYFPQHDALCREEAELGRRVLAGDVLPEGAMAGVAAELEQLYRECWGA